MPNELAELGLDNDCARRLVDAIQVGDFKPGQRLSELAVAERFEMGRAVVRAAFDQLAFVGILDRRAKSGTYVRQFHVQTYLESEQIRATLEGMAGRLACSRITDAQLDALESLAKTLDQSTAGKTAEVFQAENQFHGSIVEISRNQQLIGILANQRLLRMCLFRSCQMSFLMSNHVSDDIVTHAQIVQALRDRDAVLVERRMRRHVLLSRRYFLNYLSTHLSDLAEEIEFDPESLPTLLQDLDDQF
ncbi:GntR family transcriptional regulator [Poriferisphaera sp. WC338]|uniref:GntR family transcriptional regulator n=1 Tax=Poriferisphaera sp. WC338 TaxID=3425129 RepID=UPI003D81BE54